MDLPISFSHVRITTRLELCARAAMRADEPTRRLGSMVRSHHDAVVNLSRSQIGREKTESLFVILAISASRTYCSTKSSEPERLLSRRGSPLAPVRILPIDDLKYDSLIA
jgi:hypothetical protein